MTDTCALKDTMKRVREQAQANRKYLPNYNWKTI